MPHEVFDRLWDRYDEWYSRHPVTARNELLAAREALRGAPDPCIEIGVGTGWFASRLGCLGGVDPSLGMLRLARRRGLEAVLGRAEALPVAPGRLGAALMVVTLCFVDDPAQAVREAVRALAPGGALVACIVPRESRWGRRYEALARSGHPFYSVARFLSVEEAERLMRGAGLRVEARIATLTYGPGEPEREERPREYRGGEGFVCIRGRAVTGLERAEPPRRA